MTWVFCLWKNIYSDIGCAQDHMWQHKQEEREIKRVEGDVIKRKRALQRTMKEYETSILFITCIVKYRLH